MDIKPFIKCMCHCCDKTPLTIEPGPEISWCTSRGCSTCHVGYNPPGFDSEDRLNAASNAMEKLWILNDTP